MSDPDFLPGQTLELIADQGLTPRSVVFELTERTAIRDFAAFRKALQHYRLEDGLPMACLCASGAARRLRSVRWPVRRKILLANPWKKKEIGAAMRNL
jgi:hypothetical protein